MGIVFILTPKKEVIYTKLASTVRQVLEKMKYHNCTQMPVIDNKGRFSGVVTEEGLIKKISSMPNLKLRDFDKVGISDIVIYNRSMMAHINDRIEDLNRYGLNKSFIPVVDDNNVFIGVVKQCDLIANSIA